MKLSSVIASSALAAVLSTASASATVVTLTFEGLGNLAPVGNFYNGGGGGSLGVTFSDNALAIIDEDAGGTGNFGGEPSPSTVLFFLTGSAATLNYASGFTTGFSFFYSAVNQPGSITVYDGLDATGNVLASLALPLTPFNGAPDPTGNFSPFVPIGVAFTGIAKSIDFAGVQDQIGFDNITFGSDTPTPPSAVPVPGALPLLVSAIGALGLFRRRTRG